MSEDSDVDVLAKYFDYYCKRAPATTVMNGSKFRKAIKDMGHVGKRCSSNDLDLIFAKIKGKGKQTIDFDGFFEGCKLIAAKNHAKKKGEDAQIIAFIKKSKALPQKKKKKQDAVTARLTDPKNFGAGYKQRFNEDGTGKGQLFGEEAILDSGKVKDKGILASSGSGGVGDIQTILRPD